MTTPVWPAATRYVAHLGPRLAAMKGEGRLADAARPQVSLLGARWAGGPASEWPLDTFLELGALDGAVPSARLHARHVVREWGLAALAEDVELVVSELVTNGVQASRAMTHAAIGLWLASDRVQVVVCVWDASPQPPVRMDAAEDAEHGRGLLLVEALSKQWGWLPGKPGTMGADGQRGKIVWAVVS
jgi:anti-sigma regulatory factor (Ser/Thr protein kinase)